MFKLRYTLPFLVTLILQLLLVSQLQSQGKYLNWEMQTNIPAPSEDMPALQGAFVGSHQNVLIVAGGTKVSPVDTSGFSFSNYSSDILIGTKAENGKIEWNSPSGSQLKQSCGYGISISSPEGLFIIGGKNQYGGDAKVSLLKWNADQYKVEVIELQPLPETLVNGAGALLEGAIYVAGVNKKGEEHFFRLPIEGVDSERAWESRTPCPGPAREFGSAAVQADGSKKSFYLFGGRPYKEFRPGKWLNDCWRYDPREDSWQQVADVVANGVAYYPAGSPTVNVGVHHFLVFGPVVNGEPISSREVLAYHTITNTWTVVDTVPERMPIVSPAFWWEGKIILAGGEGTSPGPGAVVWEFSPNPVPSGLRWLDYIVIVLYLIILVGMGAHFMRRGKTTKDYFTAGKRIPWWAAGISIFGTSLSAITYMAVPAKAYGTDWLYFGLSMSQVLTVPLVIWMVLPFFRRLNVTTAYEYLEQRFHVAVRIIGGLAFLLFQFGRIGIVLFLPAIALSVVTGVSIETCIIVMAVLSIFYTVLGGIEAVIWTDVKQVVVLTVGAIVCLILMANGTEGGFDALLQIGQEDGKLRMIDLDFDFHSPTLWVVLGGGIGTNLINQTSDQTFVQRYLTTRDEKSAARSLLTPAILVLPVSLLFFGLGTALYGFFKSQPEALNPVLENADAIFPWYIVSQLPEGLSGLLIAGIFAASMSSLDSSLNSVATVLTVDFYKRLVPGRSDKSYLTFARLMTILIGVIGMGFALLLAGSEIKSLWDEFSKIIGLFAGGLAGLFLLGMSSKRATTGGALIGFAVSGGIQFWVSSTGAVHFLLYTLTGLASCYVVGWLASWLFPPRQKLEGLTISTIREISENQD